MAHSKRKRLNKHGVTRDTRNKIRKRDYAKKAEDDRRAGIRKRYGSGKHVKKGIRLVGTAVHVRPCGNIACKDCFSIFHAMLKEKRSEKQKTRQEVSV